MKRNRKLRRENLTEEPFLDENLSFIVGYTSGGAPYGITWEETTDEGEDDERRTVISDEEPPF